MYENLKKEVELVWEDHDHIRDDQAKIAIRETVRLLDEGQIRVANPNEDGSWSVNEKGYSALFSDPAGRDPNGRTDGVQR